MGERAGRGNGHGRDHPCLCGAARPRPRNQIPSLSKRGRAETTCAILLAMQVAARLAKCLAAWMEGEARCVKTTSLQASLASPIISSDESCVHSLNGGVRLHFTH